MKVSQNTQIYAEINFLHFRYFCATFKIIGSAKKIHG